MLQSEPRTAEEHGGAADLRLVRRHRPELGDCERGSLRPRAGFVDEHAGVPLASARRDLREQLQAASHELRHIEEG